jgi:hypothetical protein
MGATGPHGIGDTALDGFRQHGLVAFGQAGDDPLLLLKIQICGSRYDRHDYQRNQTDYFYFYGVHREWLDIMLTGC